MSVLWRFVREERRAAIGGFALGVALGLGWRFGPDAVDAIAELWRRLWGGA